MAEKKILQAEPELLFPRFILRDRNGAALAKAICAALNYMYERRQAGIDTLYDVDEMPQWRLNELAWEYNLALDISADADIKRSYLRDIYNCFAITGTPEGVEAYMAAYFGKAKVTEWMDYGGDAMHFKLEVSGTWQGGGMYQPLATAKKLLEFVKNVRSELDALTFDEEKRREKHCGTAMLETAIYEAPVEGVDPGSVTLLTDESGEMLLTERGYVICAD